MTNTGGSASSKHGTGLNSKYRVCLYSCLYLVRVVGCEIELEVEKGKEGKLEYLYENLSLRGT